MIGKSPQEFSSGNWTVYPKRATLHQRAVQFKKTGHYCAVGLLYESRERRIIWGCSRSPRVRAGLHGGLLRTAGIIDSYSTDQLDLHAPNYRGGAVFPYIKKGGQLVLGLHIWNSFRSGRLNRKSGGMLDVADAAATYRLLQQQLHIPIDALRGSVYQAVEAANFERYGADAFPYDEAGNQEQLYSKLALPYQ